MMNAISTLDLAEEREKCEARSRLHLGINKGVEEH